MSIHGEVEQTVRRIISELEIEGVTRFGPTVIALRTYDEYEQESDDEHIKWASVEHFKQMSRAVLRANYDPDAERSESKAYQDDMFSGHLQALYPLPREKDEEPEYVKREVLSISDLDWNIAQLRKSAQARLRHADALQSYRDHRAERAA